MKKLAILIILTITTIFCDAQVMFSSLPKDSVMEPSAMMEVKSYDRGFLPPRLSTAQRKAIKKPAPGLVVFDTTRQMFYGYVKNTGWRPFLMGYDTSAISISGSPTVADNLDGDGLGYSVAIYGNVAVASAPFDDVNGKVDQGSVYVFKNINGVWTNIQKLTASDGAANDLFGGMVTMTNSFVFVGASLADIGENLDQGAMYIYKIQGDSLIYHQKITASLASSYDKFSHFMAAQNEKLFVGAPYDDVGSNTDQGAVYYFELVNGKWVEKQKIIQDSAAASKDYFGFGISIDSGRVAIGGHIDAFDYYGYGQNSVFIYEKVGTAWKRRSKILQPNVSAYVKDEAFGYNTLLKDSMLIVGAWLHNTPVGNKDRGMAYTFKRNGANWDFVKEFAPEDLNTGDVYGDYFGFCMRMDGKYMLIGSGYEDIAAGVIDMGAFYVYELINQEWKLKQKITSPEPIQLDQFGRAVGIHNGNIIVSANHELDGGKGRVYFYTIED